MRTAARILWSVLVVGGVVAIALLAAALDQRLARDEAFVIDRFEQRVVITPFARTEVMETIDLTFLEPRRGILRDFDIRTPHATLDSFRDFEVDQGSADQPWDFRVEGGPSGPRLVIGQDTVFLDPGPYRYRIRYVAPTWFYELADEPGTVEARIDFPGYDWPTTIGPSRIVVEVPGPVTATACVEGPRRSTQPCAQPPTIDGNRVAFAVGPFEERHAATVAVRFPREALPATTQIPELDAVPLGEGASLQPLFIDRITGMILLLAALIIPILLWEMLSSVTLYRDRMTDPSLHNRAHPDVLPTPPFGWSPPEVAGLLLRRRDNELFLATLIDLDRRGIVRSNHEVIPKRSGPGKHILTVLPGAPPATPEDIEVSQVLLPMGMPARFDGKFDPHVSARVRGVISRLRSRARHVFARHGMEHGSGGLIGRPNVRGFVGVLLLLYAVGVVWLSWLLTPLHLSVAIPTAVLVLLSWMLLRFVWRHHTLPLNSAGRDAVAQARAFREFLRTVEGEQLQWAAGQPHLDHHHPAVRLLPYAVALGLADSWFSRFEGVLAELATVGASAGWYANRSSFRTVRRAQKKTSTAPSRRRRRGGGGGGSGGGGGGGRSR